jgi:precorrin-2 dehydrogenase/sirohydrochlorin ferrochelatase
MISTNGKGPKIASIIRKKLEVQIESLAPAPGGIVKAIENVGELRERLRARAPEVGGAIGRKRMRWMIGICERWSLSELSLMNDSMMNKLLDEGWENNGTVLSFASVGGARNLIRSLIVQAKHWCTLDHALHLIAGGVLGAALSCEWVRRRR